MKRSQMEKQLLLLLLLLRKTKASRIVKLLFHKLFLNLSFDEGTLWNLLLCRRKKTELREQNCEENCTEQNFRCENIRFSLRFHLFAFHNRNNLFLLYMFFSLLVAWKEKKEQKEKKKTKMGSRRR